MKQKDIQKLHHATLALLEALGVGIDSDLALNLLVEHDVRVDWTLRRVYPTEEQVERALATMPHGITVYGREPENQPVVLEGNNVYVMSGGGSLRVLTLDGRYETSTWDHLHQFNLLLDALPNIHMHINQVDPQGEPGDGFYKKLAAEMLVDCTKPLCFQTGSAADVEAMVEMGVAIRGSREELLARPLFMLGLNAEPPLFISKDVTEALIAGCKAGIPVSMGNYCMLGITAPATPAGAVVHLNAVQLVSFILAQIVRPGAPICYTSFCGSGNMQSLDPLSANPQAVRLLRMAAELGRSYGFPIYGVALTDARSPDPQAACERATELQVAVEAGVNLIQGPTSHMDQLMLSSFTQAVIDNDIVGYVLSALKEPEISDETLAFEATRDVLTDSTLAGLKFAAHPHTVSHIQDGLWNPLAFNYDNYSTWQRKGCQSVIDRAATVAADVLHNHHPKPLAPDIANAVRAIALA